MGSPVVLVHGMWCTGANWNRVRELMEARGYDCHAPTLPAHDATPDQPLKVARLSLRQYLTYLQDYIRQQDFAQPPILIGHSMGGLLAAQLAAGMEARALVLLTPAPAWGIFALKWPTIVAFARWLFSGLFWRSAHKPTAARASISVFNGVAPERHPQLYAGLVHESGRAASEVGFWPLDFSRASRVDVNAVKCPVYVVSCGLDRLTPTAVVRKMAARFAQVSQRFYANRGHWVIDDEETEEMVHSICGWLRPFEQRAARGQKPPA